MTHLDYAQARAYISSLPRFAPEPGLDRLRQLLGLLGNPQESCPCVHVGGTNGKGSATVLAATILSRAGYRTGRYTSPHLTELGERFVIDGQQLDQAGVARLVGELQPVIAALAERRGGESVIEFELLTAMAFAHFAQAGCDLSVLEVGLGGRYDATNVVERPLATVITSIGRDHTEILGEGLAAIAGEKAGIIKPGVPLITGVGQSEPLAVIRAQASSQGAELWRVAESERTGAEGEPGAGAGAEGEVQIRWQRTGYDLGGQSFDLELPGTLYRGLRIGLLGRHQLDNVACAVGAVHAVERAGWPVQEVAIREGLLEAVWPGRCELIRRSPYLMLDGAHNPEGAVALRQTVEELFGGRRCVLVLGALGDKDIETMVSTLTPLARQVIVTRPSAPGRALVEPAVLAGLVRAAGVPAEVRMPVAAALEAGWQALEDAGDLLVVTGSLYLVGEVRALLASGTQD